MTPVDQKPQRTFNRISNHILGLKSLFSRQGTVIATWRDYQGRKLGPYYRLAWREEGRQCSLYLGASEELAQSVRQLLATLQRRLKENRQWRRLYAASRAACRASRALVNQQIARIGLYLKGSEFRGWRTISQLQRVQLIETLVFPHLFQRANC